MIRHLCSASPHSPPSPGLAAPPLSPSSLFSYSFLYFFFPLSDSLLFLLLSAQCSRICCSPGDPTRANSCRGLPSLSSSEHCFPSSSSSSSPYFFFLSSSSSSCAPAIGHRGANHQCSHRPTRHSYGCFYPGTGWPPSRQVEVLFPVRCVRVCGVEWLSCAFSCLYGKSDGRKAAKSGQCNSVLGLKRGKTGCCLNVLPL